MFKRFVRETYQGISEVGDTQFVMTGIGGPIVIIQTDTDEDGRDWAIIGTELSLDLRTLEQCCRLADRTAFGIRIMRSLDDVRMIMLCDSIPLADLDPSEVEKPMRSVVASARAISAELKND